MRLVTAATANVLYETSDGGTATAELGQPSAAESGIKINADPIELNDADDRAVVTLDFSVAESFVEAGQTSTYLFKAVVDAPSVVVNGDTPETQSVGKAPRRHVGPGRCVPRFPARRSPRS